MGFYYRLRQLSFGFAEHSDTGPNYGMRAPTNESLRLKNIHIHFRDWILSPEKRTSSIYGAQLSGFHQNTETESGIRNVVFQIKDRAIDNIQNCNSYVNVLLPQTYT
jgi:hypothetical protein